MFGSLKKKLKELLGKKEYAEIKDVAEQKQGQAAPAIEENPIIEEPAIEEKPIIEEKSKEGKLAEKAIDKDIAISQRIEEESQHIIEKEIQLQEELKPLADHPVKKEPDHIRQVIDQKLGEMPKVEKENTDLEKIIEEAKPDEKEIEKARREMYGEETAPATDVSEEREEETNPISVQEEDERKKGLFTRLFEKSITEEEAGKILRELQIVLLENDVAMEVAEKICNDVKAVMLNKSVKRGKVNETIEDALRAAMLDVMKQEDIDIKSLIEKKEGVFTIMFLGFNGTGKTTTLAKFAKKFSDYKPVVAAADTFRAASIEQLEEHAKRVGFRLVKHQYGSDSAAVIFDAKKAAEATGSKLVLADTAGRSHSNINLMDELKKIVRVNTPDLKILILDAVTGNDIYDQSKLFNDAVGVDAIILTKTDVYEKGGAALSAAYTIKKPILYLGVGQEYDDLKESKPDEIVKNLLE
ncbi:MAG: signal recognition particle-docking protein FtsY [Candidatus Aenigmarchaeota archaeon]|nr:signal recognition particle-docking protein FtsY [Candidatus Aenigmarchaeota archaeon]